MAMHGRKAEEWKQRAEMAESKLKDLRFSPSHGWSVLHEQPSDHEEGSTLATATSYAASELSRHPETDSSFGSCSFHASINSSYRASFDPSLLSHCGRELDFDDDSIKPLDMSPKKTNGWESSTPPQAKQATTSKTKTSLDDAFADLE